MCVFAKDQKSILPLPAHVHNNGLVTFCMELDDDELEAVKKTKYLKIGCAHFRDVLLSRSVSLLPTCVPRNHTKVNFTATLSHGAKVLNHRRPLRLNSSRSISRH
jgi:hypothetical protein